jgi:hypothetical protein
MPKKKSKLRSASKAPAGLAAPLLPQSLPWKCQRRPSSRLVGCGGPSTRRGNSGG